MNGPKKFDTINKLANTDYDLFQMIYNFKIHGLTDEFQKCESGDYGYNLFITTGLWLGDNWKGSNIVIPATYPKEDPEASRIRI